MKLIVDQDLMERIVISMQNFLEKRDSTQITSNIYIDASFGNTLLRATDREMGIEIESQQFQSSRELVGLFVNGKEEFGLRM